MIESGYTFFVTSASVTLAVFAIQLLVLRVKQQQAYFPLVIFFTGLVIILSKPLVAGVSPVMELYVLVFSLPALLVLPPSFWCYVEGLTHTKQWRFHQGHLKHFVLPLCGLLVSLVTLILPTDLVRAVLTNGETALSTANSVMRYFIYGLLISTFILILAWLVQSSYYVFAVFRRLSTYRQQLKQVFASTEAKEFYWISWLLIAIGCTWLLLATYLFVDNLVGSLAFSFEPFKILVLAMIWTIAVWALRHKPGFQEIYHEDTEAIVFDVDTSTQAKYQHSALTEQQATDIAYRVNALMTDKKVYLDANISLQKLALLVNTTPNYLSQTLNEQLNTSFFDYVNKHRIEAAGEQLIGGDKSVLDIAMDVGFNSKSSFYTAFKKTNNTTPTAYRKQHKQTG